MVERASNMALGFEIDSSIRVIMALVRDLSSGKNKARMASPMVTLRMDLEGGISSIFVGRME